MTELAVQILATIVSVVVALVLTRGALALCLRLAFGRSRA
jgi:hypothetical protein